MREISQASLDKINLRQGLEPITIVEIYWVYDSTSIHRLDGQPMRGNITGQKKVYADRQQPGINGKLLEISGLENTVNITNNTTSQSISVKLDDNDHQLKDLFDRNDIHKKMVFVKQWFYGLNLNDAFILFEGEISSPIIWKEGDRTLSFTVVSKLEDREVGFSAEEGDFDLLPATLIGKAWPLIFGTVKKVPSIQLNTIPTPITQDNIQASSVDAIDKMHKYSDDNQKNVAQSIADAYNKHFWYALLSAHYLGLKETAEWNIQKEEAKQWYEQFLQAQKTAQEYLASTWDMAKQNKPYFDPYEEQRLSASQTPIPIVNPVAFPPGVPVTIEIEDASFTGTFSSDGSSVTPLGQIGQPTLGTIDVGPTNLDNKPLTTFFNQTYTPPPTFYKTSGIKIKIIANLHVRYIACLEHCTVVTVWAKRKISDGTSLYTPVPSNYYLVTYETYGLLKVTIVTMTMPLSSKKEGWEDDIACDLTSPVGPNAVDVMKWLIDTYTSHTYDTSEFNSIRGSVSSTPVGFVLTKRMNVITLLQDIAFQIRCALWFVNGTFRLKFLARQGIYVDTITEDNIENNSLEVTTTETEDIVTKLTGTWKENELQPTEYKIIYRYAIAKYGIKEQTFPFYIFNQLPFVQMSAIFWLIRKGNTWKRIRFDTFLDKIRLEPFDVVRFNFTNNWIANTAVDGIIESVKLDTSNQRISIEAWVPVRFGEMTAYSFAHPESISGTVIYPQPNDPYAGGQTANTPANSNLLKSTLNDKTYDNKTFGKNGKLESAKDDGSKAPLNSNSLEFTTDSVSEGGLVGSYLNTPILPNMPALDTAKPLLKDPLKKDNITLTTRVYPAQVISGSGDLYSMRIFVNGLDEAPETVQNVKQLILAPNETIPEDSWTFVVRNDTGIYNTKLGIFELKKTEWVMNFPTWLADDENP
jgi:hypothetical protein